MPLKQTLKHLALQTFAATDRSAPPLAGIENFLILQHASALGTVIHATPLIPALRQAVPNAKIIVATSGFGLEVFQGNPGVYAVVPAADPTRDWLLAKRDLSEQARSFSGTFATLTPLGNERTAIALNALWAGATSRVGFTLAPELYRAPLSFDPALSQIANNLRIIVALGHTEAQHHEPQVFFSETDTAYARALLTGYDPSRPLIVFVTQTSPTQCKGWRPERFIAAAEFLVKHYAAQIVFVGTAPERKAIETIRASVVGTTWNLAGETTVQQLSALLGLCTAGLTLDTGTMHLGRAVGLPMVIVAPAWSPPIEWLPIGNPRFTILKNLDMPTAPEGYIIDEVSVDEVTTSLADLLQSYPRAG